ncbi:MAG: phenylacetate--CoA ligase family protein [Deltaproteobacteria bacterium]|nr:phenylacetate--CoA ligase family protein [Deltaproteobacteria bacterium]
MHRSQSGVLRADLRLTCDGDPADESSTWALYDPITLRSFEVPSLQAQVLRALEEGRSQREIAAELAADDDPEAAEAMLGEYLASLDDLALLRGERSADEIRRLQREARRRELKEDQRAALGSMLARVTRVIPYYQDTLAPLGPEEQDHAIDRLPILSKDTLRAEFPRFLPSAEVISAMGSDAAWGSTSGTTGDRLQVVSSSAYSIDAWNRIYNFNAQVVRSLRKDRELRAARLTSPICSGTECHVGRSVPYEERADDGELLLETSMNILGDLDDMFENMLKELHQFEPDYLIVNPSYLAAFARYIVRHGATVPRISFVVTTYELLSRVHRKLIQTALSCPVWAGYASSESGPIAMECEHGRIHVSERDTLAEVRTNGRAATAGETGRLVLTTLNKPLTPLLRYDSQDLVTVAPPCDCGRSETDVFASLEGRLKDVVFSGAGLPVTPNQVDEAFFRAETSICFYSLVQRGPRLFTANVVAEEGFDKPMRDRLTDSLHSLLGSDVRINVEARHELRPEVSGKFRLAYQENPTGLSELFLP